MGRNPAHITGELAEFKVAETLVENGCRVSYTYGQYPYDLIGDTGSELLTIQVKTATTKDGRECTYRINTDGYKPGDFDLFAGYAAPEEDVFFVPYEDTGSYYSVTYRSEDELTEYNAKRANLAADHTFPAATDALRARGDRQRERVENRR